MTQSLHKGGYDWLPDNEMGLSKLQCIIDRERDQLRSYISIQLAPLAAACVADWGQPYLLDRRLLDAFADLGNCRLLYAMNCDGIQHSSNVSAAGLDPVKRSQDLSVRPYMKAAAVNGDHDFVLSPVYVDRDTDLPCITGMHRVVGSDGEILGCIAADYTLGDLPDNRAVENPLLHCNAWRQIKGDPAIRQNLFDQVRVTSVMDEHLQQVTGTVTDLITNRGVFHAKLHYSASRSTLWLYADPHRYRLHVTEEIIDPSVCLAYPRRPYPHDAVVDTELVRPVYNQFQFLRNADQTIYLRSASLNIINGMVGLNFSCDGSHYMSADEFLGKNTGFWFG